MPVQPKASFYLVLVLVIVTLVVFALWRSGVFGPGAAMSQAPRTVFQWPDAPWKFDDWKALVATVCWLLLGATPLFFASILIWSVAAIRRGSSGTERVAIGTGFLISLAMGATYIALVPIVMR